MLSAARTRASNATICYIASKCGHKRTKQSSTWTTSVKLEVVLKKAVRLGQKQRNRRFEQTRVELLRRKAEKQKAQESARRRKVERKFNTIECAGQT